MVIAVALAYDLNAHAVQVGYAIQFEYNGLSFLCSMNYTPHGIACERRAVCSFMSLVIQLSPDLIKGPPPHSFPPSLKMGVSEGPFRLFNNRLLRPDPRPAPQVHPLG